MPGQSSPVATCRPVSPTAAYLPPHIPRGRHHASPEPPRSMHDLILLWPACRFRADLRLAVNFIDRSQLVDADILEIVDRHHGETFPCVRSAVWTCTPSVPRPSASATSGMRRIVRSMSSSTPFVIQRGLRRIAGVVHGLHLTQDHSLNCCTVPTAKMPTAIDATTSIVRVRFDHSSRNTLRQRGEIILSSLQNQSCRLRRASPRHSRFCTRCR